MFLGQVPLSPMGHYDSTRVLAVKHLNAVQGETTRPIQAFTYGHISERQSNLSSSSVDALKIHE